MPVTNFGGARFVALLEAMVAVCPEFSLLACQTSCGVAALAMVRVVYMPPANVSGTELTAAQGGWTRLVTPGMSCPWSDASVAPGTVYCTPGARSPPMPPQPLFDCPVAQLVTRLVKSTPQMRPSPLVHALATLGAKVAK